MNLDLSREEKRRVTALMLAIQAYSHLIIKDGMQLHEAADLARRGEYPKLEPATINAMVEAALQFDYFIATGKKLITAETGIEIEQEPAEGECENT